MQRLSRRNWLRAAAVTPWALPQLANLRGDEPKQAEPLPVAAVVPQTSETPFLVPPTWVAERMTDGKLALLCAEAESVPGPILEIGNTNSRYRFACGAREFVNRWNSHGPAHHCAVGVGHLADKLAKLGALLGLETIRVV